MTHCEVLFFFFSRILIDLARSLKRNEPVREYSSDARQKMSGERSLAQGLEALSLSNDPFSAYTELALKQASA